MKFAGLGATPSHMADVLVLGSGPAGLALAAALGQTGLRVIGLAPQPPDTPWTHTYGVWEDELTPLGLTHLLQGRWSDTIAYMDDAEIPLHRVYGLFDNRAVQDHLLAQCARGQVSWERGKGASVTHGPAGSVVTDQRGRQYGARLLVDASGHRPALVRRPPAADTAYQAAFGLVARFPRAPIEAERMVLMDYRAHHLKAAEIHRGPPTFLYAMHLGEDRYFVEETSLAAAPAVPLGLLAERLYRRLAHHGAAMSRIEHVERCLFPMNLPLPYLNQRSVAFGGAASMVHPATGYQVCAALSRAPHVARVVAGALARSQVTPQELAALAWQAVWPPHLLHNHYLYRFGLQNLLRFDLAQTRAFFREFFRLPTELWQGYLSNTHSPAELRRTMLALFANAPWSLRWALMSSSLDRADLLVRAFARR